MATSPPNPAAPAPASPASSPPATCRTASTARPSPPPAPAAWRRWRRRSGWATCPPRPPPSKPGPEPAMPLDWDKLRVFHAVAEAGSFTHAGETLNLSQSAVSRQIQALEEALQVALLRRHARGLIRPEPGETLNRRVREVFAKLVMTEALLTESRERPAGRLKVTSTTGFGSTWLAPRLGRFLQLYPDVSVTLLLDDSDLDLAMREADVAIRMH